ncbi:MAG: hypothetical protein HQL20_00465 [Candidatus Omnitrophica bacterium]|nr:hypothetical protein [Candidatus Omnitrophota bacterium]
MLKIGKFSVSWIIFSVILVSLCYRIYLACTTNMIICWDSLEYRDLGRLLQNNDFLSYFKGGPRREPIYPVLVSVAMHMESWSGIVYTRILAGIGVGILFITQVLMYIVLRKLNVRIWICAFILLYFGFSPAINNTAFSLYSEISVLPWTLLSALLIAKSFETIISKNIVRSFFAGAGIGSLFVIMTMIKAPFELVFFVFVGLYFVLLLRAFIQKNRPVIIKALVFIFTLCLVYEVPVTAYKMLNKVFNNNYALTGRGSWALYGGVALKTEPMTARKILTAIAHIPGNGACMRFFSEEECTYWEAFSASDGFGLGKYGQVSSTTPAADVDRVILGDCKKRILEHPFQYVFMSSFDWIKMFFWESTKIGFVEYPPWLETLYNKTIFKDGLRLLVSLGSLIAFIILLLSIRNPVKLTDSQCPATKEQYLRFTIFVILLFYTGLHSMFNTVTRWALPLAPLYLVCVGYALQLLWPKPRSK